MEKIKFTVWIIAQQDGEHLLEYDFMLRSIIKGRNSSENIDLVRVMLLHYDQERKLSTIKTLKYIEDSTKPALSGERFIILEQKNEKESDIYDLCISNFLKKYIDKNHKNIVILWGHGNGLGLGYFYQSVVSKMQSDYFNNINITSQSTETIKQANKSISLFIQLTTILSNKVFTVTNEPFNFNVDIVDLISKLFVGTAPLTNSEKDEINSSNRGKYLSAEQLSKILIDGLGKKAELLIINSCYMQMLESLFYMAECTNIVTASQSSFPFLGYEFESFFTKLQKTVGTASPDLKFLATDSVASLNKKYKSTSFFTEILENYYVEGLQYDVVNDVALSSVDLSEVNDFLGIIDQIGKFLNDKMLSGNSKKINTAREKSETPIEESDYDVFIDLLHFLNLYSQQLPVEHEFEDLLGKLNLIVKTFRIAFKKANNNKGNPQLLSFIMPDNLESNDPVADQIKELVVEIFSSDESTIRKKLPNWSDFIVTWTKSLS